jgi:7,8-dihydro-6-hydroxymethylpterin-pyrophosphokinase
MHERAFVVVPLTELRAGDMLPDDRRLEPVTDAAQVVRRFAPALEPGEN